jgi:hypothetical protein
MQYKLHEDDAEWGPTRSPDPVNPDAWILDPSVRYQVLVGTPAQHAHLLISPTKINGKPLDPLLRRKILDCSRYRHFSAWSALDTTKWESYFQSSGNDLSQWLFTKSIITAENIPHPADVANGVTESIDEPAFNPNHGEPVAGAGPTTAAAWTGARQAARIEVCPEELLNI